MSTYDKGRRAKLMFELVEAADRQIKAGLNTLQPGMFGENDEVIAAAMALAAHLRTNPDEPDSALVAEVARLRKYLEVIGGLAAVAVKCKDFADRTLTLILEYASEALRS